MELYLVQHGKARSKEEDPERGLTDEGLAESEATAAFLARLEPRIDGIWHSGKRRAEQTARIFGDSLSIADAVAAREHLAPQDDVSSVRQQLAAPSGGNLMIVGHLPYLSNLTSALVTGHPGRQIVRFRNSCIVCLEGMGDGWLLSWMITPEETKYLRGVL
jgi:phosphohistidine phosphatase